MIKIEKGNNGIEFGEYEKKIKGNKTLYKVTGDSYEISNLLQDLICFLLNDYNAVFYAEGLGDSIDEIKQVLNKKMLFYATNGNELINPFRAIAVSITSEKNVKKAIDFWTSSNPEKRLFVFDKNKEKNSFLDMLIDKDVMILNIPSYLGNGFYFICRNDMNFDNYFNNL